MPYREQARADRVLRLAQEVLTEEEGTFAIKDLAQKVLERDSTVAQLGHYWTKKTREADPLEAVRATIYYLWKTGKLPKDRVLIFLARKKKAKPSFCGNCGTRLPQTSNICSECGYRTKMMWPRN